MTLQVTFSESDKEQIQYNRYHHPHAHVQRSMEILWRKSLGLKHQTITEIVAVYVNTVPCEV